MAPPTPHPTRRAVLLGALVVLAGCTVPAPPPLRARVAWRFQAVGDVLGLAAAPGLVLAGTGRGAVHALDAATGSQRWAESLLLRAARPTVVGGMLVASDTTDTSALDVATGRRRWQVPGTILAAGDAVLVLRSRWAEPPLESGTLTGLDPATGTPRWSLGWAGPPPTATLSADAVHLLGPDRVVTVAAADGAGLWERPVTAGPPPAAGPAGVTVLDGDALTCLDARTGAVVWQVAGVTAGRLSVAGALACGSGGDRVSAWDAATGEPAWTWPAEDGSTDGGAAGGSERDPAGGSGSGGGGPGGSTEPAPGGVARSLGPAAAAGDTVVLTADVTRAPATDGRRVAVVALDTRTGVLRWRLDLPDPTPSGSRSGPVATDAGVVVAAAGSWISALAVDA